MHIKKVSPEQQEVLVSWLEAHRDVASGRHRLQRGTDSLERQWSAIAVELNSIGVEKDPRKWQQVWRDWKGNIKKKIQRLSKNSSKNVGLSALDERILALMREDTKQTEEPSHSRESSIRGEPLEFQCLDESEASLGSDSGSCLWEIPSPPPVDAMDLPYTKHGVDTARTEKTDDPLVNTQKNGGHRKLRSKQSYYNERSARLQQRQLNQRARRLDLEHKRLELDRRRLRVDKEQVATLRSLSQALDRLKGVVDALGARLSRLEKSRVH